MTWLHEVKVGNVDVTSYVLDWTVTRARDSDDVEPATLWIMQGVTSLEVLKHNVDVTIKRGLTTATDQFIFKGKITNISNDNGILRCDLRPPHWVLKRQIINEIFDNTSAEAGDVTSIWETIAKGEDDTITVSTESSASLPLLQYFVCNGETRWDKTQELRKLIKWQSFYRPDTDTYYLQPEGFTEFTTPFTVGINILNNPIWDYDVESIFNDITVLGAFDDARFQESFNGDGVSKIFELTYVPEDTEIYLGSISQANLQVMGIENSSSGFDYTVEREKRQIIFESAPPAGTDNVIINYTYLQQRPVRQKNKTSIEKYGVSMYEVGYDTVLSIEDAKIQAQALIDVFSTPFRSTALFVLDYENLFPGNRITIYDPQNNEVGTELTVNSIVYQYTSEHDVLEVGDKNYRLKDLILDIIQNITSLYKRKKDNQDIITDINLIENSVITHITKERYKASPVEDVLYWGDANQGTWGSFNWGPETETFSLVKRTHSKNVFYDDYTADHYTNTSGSSDVSVTGGQLVFSSGGLYLSQAIHIDNTLITQLTPTWELDSGIVKVEFRTDAGIWRTATNGETLQFSIGSAGGTKITSFSYAFPIIFTGLGDERGTELYMRITETDSSTAAINKMQINING